MGNAQDTQQSPSQANPQLIKGLAVEYCLSGDSLSCKSVEAGWTDEELFCLLALFVDKCYEIELAGAAETTSAGAKSKKDHKPDKKKEMTLAGLQVPQQDAIKNIVVFNQSFANYPFLFDRFWAIFDPGNTGFCTFTFYARVMHQITRGSYEERMKVAFNLFKGRSDGEYLTKEDVIQVVTHVSEFTCNVARGLLTMKEFNGLKLSEVDQLFGRSNKLNLQQFTAIADQHQALLGCYEILDMVFGRVIRKVEKKLKRPFVFGRYLVETALGSVKDITGEMPFVPEVIASAIHYLRDHKGLQTKELFRLSVELSELNKIKEKLNAGLTLRSILQTEKFQKPGDNEFHTLGILIKTYCRELIEPVFTKQGARQIITVQESNQPEPQKLERFLKVFQTLPTPNRYFLAAILPFLKETAVTQEREQPQQTMNASNLGVVFAPCLLYDPTDPTFGALSAPNAFAVFIEHAELFVPHPARAIAPAPSSSAVSAPKKSKKRNLPETPSGLPPQPQVVGPPPQSQNFPPPPQCVINNNTLPISPRGSEELEKLKQELAEVKKERDALLSTINKIHTITKPQNAPPAAPVPPPPRRPTASLQYKKEVTKVPPNA